MNFKVSRKIGIITTALLSSIVGFVLGAAAIHSTAPLAPIELPAARSPWNPKDILGLIGSAGIRNLSGHLDDIPLVILETDRTFVLSVSSSKSNVHYVLVPKKDIRDASQITGEDAAYLVDIFLTARQLIEKNKLKNYRIYTNGSGLQMVGYLHFHLIGKKPA
jgi:diadenosine tetraphosphate (Ap4A) HIT family hydrolase